MSRKPTKPTPESHSQRPPTLPNIIRLDNLTNVPSHDVVLLRNRIEELEDKVN